MLLALLGQHIGLLEAIADLVFNGGKASRATLHHDAGVFILRKLLQYIHVLRDQHHMHDFGRLHAARFLHRFNGSPEPGRDSFTHFGRTDSQQVFGFRLTFRFLDHK